MRRILRYCAITLTCLGVTLLVLGSVSVTSFLATHEIVYVAKKGYHRELTRAELAVLYTKCTLTAWTNPLYMNCFGTLDPHTYYISRAAFVTSQAEKPYVGIGILVEHSDNPPGVYVTHLFENGPSERAGMRVGDVIIEINGESTAPLTLEQAITHIREGEMGSVVNIQVQRTGVEKPVLLTVTRESLVQPVIFKDLKANGVGYVYLMEFQENAGDSVRDAAEKLQRQNGKPLSGLVLDLRGNPGGMLDGADGVMDLFLTRSRYTQEGVFNEDMATTLQEEYRGEIQPNLLAGGSLDILEGAPLVILVNGYSASASELVAGALQIHGRAVVVGVEKTFGKGTVQSWITLYSGGIFVLTTSQYLIGPLGCERAVQGVGVTPDIFIMRKENETPAERWEKELPGAIATSTVSNANCQYRFSVSERHLTEARQMLRIMGLEPMDPL